jgi:hypothetical protein
MDLFQRLNTLTHMRAGGITSNLKSATFMFEALVDGRALLSLGPSQIGNDTTTTDKFTPLAVLQRPGRSRERRQCSALASGGCPVEPVEGDGRKHEGGRRHGDGAHQRVDGTCARKYKGIPSLTRMWSNRWSIVPVRALMHGVENSCQRDFVSQIDTCHSYHAWRLTSQRGTS